MERSIKWKREEIKREETRVSRGSALWPTSIGYSLIGYIFIIFLVCYNVLCDVLFIGQQKTIINTSKQCGI